MYLWRNETLSGTDLLKNPKYIAWLASPLQNPEVLVKFPHSQIIFHNYYVTKRCHLRFIKGVKREESPSLAIWGFYHIIITNTVNTRLNLFGAILFSEKENLNWIKKIRRISFFPPFFHFEVFLFFIITKVLFWLETGGEGLCCPSKEIFCVIHDFCVFTLTLFIYKSQKFRLNQSKKCSSPNYSKEYEIICMNSFSITNILGSIF